MSATYEVLPSLRARLIEELHEFLKADDGRFYVWEIAVFIPAVNLFIHYIDGVNESLKNDNYVATMANVRGLIESLAVGSTDSISTSKQKELIDFCTDACNLLEQCIVSAKEEKEERSNNPLFQY